MQRNITQVASGLTWAVSARSLIETPSQRGFSMDQRVTQWNDLISFFMGSRFSSSKVYSSGVFTRPVTLSLHVPRSTFGIPLAA